MILIYMRKKSYKNLDQSAEDVENADCISAEG